MHLLLFKWFSLFLLLGSSTFCVSGSKIPRLGTIWRNNKNHESQRRTFFKTHDDDDDFQTYYYTQRLDHFNYNPESYINFQQRYMISFKNCGGAKSGAPIFAWHGAEQSLDQEFNAAGFPKDNAPHFNALLVYIEHRYYGESIPFGSYKEAMRNASTRGYFNSAQALADYAAILLHIKKTLNAHNSPIIVFGGSYGGMLAAWFRLKYPHIALGALASSAPLLYFDGVAPKHGYYYVETSESCYRTIRKSWYKIDEITKKPHGLSILSKRFRSCEKLRKVEVLKDYLESMYSMAAQYNIPISVESLCGVIDKAAKKTDINGQIFEAVAAVYIPKTNNHGNSSCYDINTFDDPNEQFQDELEWNWQTCSEMVMPVGVNEDDSMFQPHSFSMKDFINSCKKKYGIIPQPHWDMKLVFKRFASNIIFSNGLKDPYSSAGVALLGRNESRRE
ncbi:hypothetical protein PIB30_023086 [Stylosanthes scabra]|uniref:Lysosomal Pro-X carboxypeptidase n=1 Tax=Stylosanthes scabra TaxID=79078 RepID=A0ABU6YBF1_9FABA|nr:hypothetical protein [Stylosanthes scabra]